MATRVTGWGCAKPEGQATLEARLDYAAERLRLLYVGITRARRELVVTRNTGQRGDCTEAVPLAALRTYPGGTNMSIDPDFTFSANSLQDYVDCPRRFELKYLLKRDWPAEESEPVLEWEHDLQLGTRSTNWSSAIPERLPEEVLIGRASTIATWKAGSATSWPFIIQQEFGRILP